MMGCLGPEETEVTAPEEVLGLRQTPEEVSLGTYLWEQYWHLADNQSHEN